MFFKFALLCRATFITFLLAALSTGGALAYSGCAGSFSTNNLTRQHTERFYTIGNLSNDYDDSNETSQNNMF